MLVDLIIATVITAVIFGGHALSSSFSSSSPEARHYEYERKRKKDMADIDPETGDYTSKSEGSRHTKDGGLIHY